MSMIISATNYLNSAYQNMRTASTEKSGQKDSTAEPHIFASLDQVSLARKLLPLLSWQLLFTPILLVCVFLHCLEALTCPLGYFPQT
ncbi:hypothetical protein D1159_17695 [Pseudoflavonifractor sp. 524-17]|nr:hypothetical protein [Pseudoflavonifractor sp. 524-17]